MRKPTPLSEAFAWHARAMKALSDASKRYAPEGPEGQKFWIELRDDGLLLFPDGPQCGWYRRRLIRGGPWVPARIWLVQSIEDGMLVSDEFQRCQVNAAERDPEEEWLWLARQPITHDEFVYLAKVAGWAEAYDPNDPAAQPRKKIDLMKVSPPIFGKKGRSK